MPANFTDYQEFPIAAGVTAAQAAVAGHQALDGPLRAWITAVGGRSPLQALTVQEGPGQAAGFTGWTIRCQCANADAASRSVLWMLWHLDLSTLRLTLGCSRDMTPVAGGYSSVNASESTTATADYSAAAGSPFTLTVAACDTAGAEWFLATLAQGNTTSRSNGLLIFREQSTGLWVMCPAVTGSQRCYAQQANAPFDFCVFTPHADRNNHNQFMVPATYHLPPLVAVTTTGLHPTYVCPDDIGFGGAINNFGWYVVLPDGSEWLTAARGFLVQIKEATP